MNTILPRHQVIIIPERKYWKTYLVCTMFLATFGVTNMVVSVHSMYSSNTSQELEFKRTHLTQEVRDLEQQRAKLSNIQTVQELALQEGYTPVEKLQYIETPSTQIVAQR